MKVTSKINIDLRHPNAGVRVDAVQGDVNTRAVEISLFDGGSAWKVPSGVTAALAYKKPDSKQGFLDSSASVTVSGSTITIVMTKQMLATPGTVNACVVMTDASKNQLTSFPFSVSVASNPAADVQQSDEPVKVDTSDATATAGDILAGKTAYVNGKKVTGSIASRSAQTITPGTTDQTIASGQYLSGKQTIKGDANLLPGNIKSGVSVFGVDGTYVGAVGIDTSDATAAAEDIAKGKTAYVNGGKVTGTHECSEGLDTSDATAEAGDILAGKTAYVNGQKVTGTIQSKVASDLTTSGASVSVPAGYYASDVSKSVSTANQAVPTISVGADGTITAKTNQSAGYVAAGTKSTTKQLTTQAAQTITPSTEDKTISSGKYLTGVQTIKGDANLLPGNIKSGVSIFGVAGTLEAAAAGTGLSVKTGETTSAVFDVGLSELKALLLYTSTKDRVGLVNAAYIAGSEKGIICGVSSYNYSISNYAFYSDTYRYFTFADGIVTWNTDGKTSSFVEGNTYTWVAVGIE